MDFSHLAELALKARDFAYCPYSRFRVGAALLTKSGKYYTGCNVENAAYGGCICAERTAIVKAVSEGEQEFVAIACATDRDAYLAPCGVCRQFIGEFGGDILVLLCNKDGRWQEPMPTLDELLPRRFVLSPDG